MTDQIDLSSAQLGAPDSPDVRNWPILAPLTRVHLAASEVYPRGNVNVFFQGKAQLPAANGSQGPIACTLWMGCRINGQWHIAPIVECIGEDYVPTGNLFAPNQVGSNLLYYCDGPLRTYQPKPGELVAFFCTTGDTRRQNVQVVAQARTTVVLVPFQVGDYSFTDASVPPSQPPVVVTPPQAPSVDLSPILSDISIIQANYASVQVRQSVTDGLLQQLQGRVGALEADRSVILARLQALTSAPVPLPAPAAPVPAPAENSSSAGAGQAAGELIGGLLSGWLGRKKK